MKYIILIPALALVPVHGFAQSPGIELFSSANAAYTAGQLDSALARVDRAIALEPGLAQAFKLRGDIHQRQHRHDAALADYKTSEQLDAGDPRLYVSRSALFITEGKAKAGLREADKALELAPADVDAWYNRAWALYQGGDLDAALKSVRKALQPSDEFPEALYLSGVIKGAQYDEEEGAAEISRALAMKPSIPGGLMSLAVLLFEGKRYQEAITKFSEVIATDTTELADAYYYRADCYYNLGDKERACLDWSRSMRLGEKDAAFIKRNYCDTDATKIPKKPKRQPRKTTIEF
ncbi:MAG: tetratricopeptide repeat protein [Flavobacteriales bacterium]|nr:tetratricopeptide repeat protein [Flavobacteriales bacterium]HRO39862.1 tetratricopeptide repeat protein [Flavobacteriales bacterium]HRP80555.1 tetratricopeptide repeat protein [Flavobacteriales bacterium]